MLHVDLVGLLVMVGLESLPCTELVCENHCWNVRGRVSGGVKGDGGVSEERGVSNV
jgi:hypothetical protein